MFKLATNRKQYANRQIKWLNEVNIQVRQATTMKEWSLDIPKPTLAQLDGF
jgi:tRNA A37 N6-isopentenylltransferase MiaA